MDISFKNSLQIVFTYICGGSILFIRIGTVIMNIKLTEMNVPNLSPRQSLHFIV